MSAAGRHGRTAGTLRTTASVQRVLDAAAATSSDRELAGEPEAVRAFLASRRMSAGTVPSVNPSLAASTATRPARTGLRAALAALGAATLLSSGVALAATGHVPFAHTVEKVARHLLGQADDSGGHPATHHGRDRAGALGPTGRSPRAAVLRGMCHRYVREWRVGDGDAVERRPDPALVAAAGGRAHVVEFCGSLPTPGHRPGRSHGGSGTRTPSLSGPSASPTHPAHPSHPAHPAHPTHPAAGPTSRPSNGPSTHPTHATHPTHSPKPTHEPLPSHIPKPMPSHPAPPSHGG